MERSWWKYLLKELGKNKTEKGKGIKKKKKKIYRKR